MRNQGRRRSGVGKAMMMLALFEAGCAVLEPGVPDVASSHSGAGAAAMSAPGKNGSHSETKAPGPGPVGAAGLPLPGGIVPAAYEPPSQALAMLSQKLSAAEDDRQVLMARLSQAEALLKSRDQALAASAQEIDAARTELSSTRSEMERWRQEINALREKLQRAEKENVGTLESMIHMLEQVLEAESERGPGSKPSAATRENAVER